MKYHLGNLAYMECHEQCKSVESVTAAVHFNEHKLKLIDSLVQEKKLKDNLYRNVVMHYLLKVKDSPESTLQFMSSFATYSPNNSHNKEITSLYNDIKNLQPNRPLPKLALFNVNGRPTTLNEIANDGAAVFYFWTGARMSHLKKTLLQLEILNKKFPHYTFVGINRDTDYNLWQKIISEEGMPRENQFRSEDFELLKNSLVIDHLNKGIVTNKGLIVNAFADLYDLSID